MDRNRTHRDGCARDHYAATIGTLMLLMTGVASAEGLSDSTMELYGHVMLDMDYEDEQSDPDWFDVLRPTKFRSCYDFMARSGRCLLYPASW